MNFKLPALISACAALLPCPLHARLPELDAIFYGKVRHNNGALLSPSSAGQMIVKATLNGGVIAQSSMAALSSDYKLKIPLDDGAEPRLAGTARFGERVHIIVRNVSTGVEFEATESAGAGLSISSIKGDVTRQDLSVTGNLGGDTTSAGYNAWAAGYPLMPQGIANSGGDFDSDGFTNMQEFTTGTDPTRAEDNFQILQTVKANNVYSLRYGPIRLSRVYTIFSAPTPTGAWVKVAEVTPNVNAAFAWQDILDHGEPQIFFKISVSEQ